MTNTAATWGLLVDVIAARFPLAATLPQETPSSWLPQPGLLPHVAVWLGTSSPRCRQPMLAPVQPGPGQLAGLSARLGISGHGITTRPPPTCRTGGSHADLAPSPDPAAEAAPGSLASTAAELPGLAGARLAVLGLHQAERGTILHLHAGGVTMEDDWEYYRAVRPLPTLWIRDHAGRWHATRDYAPRPLGDDGEVTLSW